MLPISRVPFSSTTSRPPAASSFSSSSSTSTIGFPFSFSFYSRCARSVPVPRRAFPFRSPSLSISRLQINILCRCDRVERKDKGQQRGEYKKGERDQTYVSKKDLLTTTSSLQKTRRAYCKKAYRPRRYIANQ